MFQHWVVSYKTLHKSMYVISFVRLRWSGGIHQLCCVLPLRPSGGREEHEHLIVDAAAVRPALCLFGDSNPESRLRRHLGSFVLQKSGLSSPSGRCRMEVGVQNADRRWRKRTARLNPKSL